MSGKDKGTKKAASSEGRGRRMGRGVGSVSIESTVRSDPPCVNGGRGDGTHLARHNQCTVDCSLRSLERGGCDGSEISASGRVDVNVEGLHRLAINGCGCGCEHGFLKIILP